jgi:nucleoside-diphosphate-sugar epimerase
MGKDIKPKYDEGRKGDIKHSLADISLAKRLIGYTPKFTFKEGLKKTIEWYKSRSKG